MQNTAAVLLGSLFPAAPVLLACLAGLALTLNAHFKGYRQSASKLAAVAFALLLVTTFALAMYGPVLFLLRTQTQASLMRMSVIMSMISFVVRLVEAGAIVLLAVAVLRRDNGQAPPD
jgi:hypothetical protein